MKLEKLLTLSQFVDYLQSINHDDKKSILLNKDRESYTNEILIEHLHAIESYNNFLKQPLTKDMFVNEIPPFSERKKDWQEAEKKVIFDGWRIGCDEGGYYFEKDDILIYRYEWAWILDCDNTGEINICTLHDLAEATNGELKLKNVEL